LGSLLAGKLQQRPESNEMPSIEDLVAEFFYANFRQSYWGWFDANAFRFANLFVELEDHVHVYVVHDDVGIFMEDKARAAPSLVDDLAKAWVNEWIESTRELLAAIGDLHPRVHLVAAEAVRDQLEKVFSLSGLKTSTVVDPRPLETSEFAVAKGNVAFSSWVWTEWAKTVAPDLEPVRMAFRRRLSLRSAAETFPVAATVAAIADRGHLHSSAEGMRTPLKTDPRSASEIRDMSRRLKASQGRGALLEKKLAERVGLQIQLEASVLHHSAAEQVANRHGAGLARERDVWRARARFLQGRLESAILGIPPLSKVASATAAVLLKEFWRDQQPVDLWVDLRRPFAGHNWHTPEEDGCWSGGSSTAEILIPSLRKGTYRVELELMGAMCDLFQETPYLAFGESRARSNVMQIAHDSVFPLLLSATLSNRQDSGKATSLMIGEIGVSSPAENGLADSRALGIRVRTVRFCLLSESFVNG
jgi:hypothetical protein